MKCLNPDRREITADGPSSPLWIPCGSALQGGISTGVDVMTVDARCGDEKPMLKYYAAIGQRMKRATVQTFRRAGFELCRVR